MTKTLGGGEKNPNISVTPPSSKPASFDFRTGRLPRLQVRPLRAGEGSAPLPVSQSPGEPRLHEGRPEGARAAVAGAETQTCLRGASLQTCVLRRRKKRVCVCQCFEFLLLCLSFYMCFSFHPSWLTAAAAAAAADVCLLWFSVSAALLGGTFSVLLDFIAVWFLLPLYFLPFPAGFCLYLSSSSTYDSSEIHIGVHFALSFLLRGAPVFIKSTSSPCRQDCFKCQLHPSEWATFLTTLCIFGWDSNFKNSRFDFHKGGERVKW